MTYRVVGAAAAELRPPTPHEPGLDRPQAQLRAGASTRAI